MSPSAKMRRIVQNKSGVSAVEFALTAPVIVGIFMGMVQIATMVQNYLINSDTAHLVADLVSRCRAVSSSDITDDMKAAAFMLNSKSTMPAGYSTFISSITFDATSGNASVAWTQSVGSAPASTATAISHITSYNMNSPGNSVIVVGVNDGTSTSYGYAVPRLTPQIPLVNTTSSGCT